MTLPGSDPYKAAGEGALDTILQLALNGGRLLGHRDVSTTMVYTHVLNRPLVAVRSTADRMFGL